MKNRLLSILLCLVLILALPCRAYASDPASPKIVDNAELLTPEEAAELSSKAFELRDTLELDVVIVTTWSLDGMTAQEYADDFYDKNGYGYGDDGSGILLLLAMESREWYMSTCGEAIYIFTDYGLDQLGDTILPYLAAGEYYEAFSLWMDELPDYCDAYWRGDPYDGYAPPDNFYPEGGDEVVHYQPQRQTSPVSNFLIALLIGAVVALVAVLIMRSKMNTARHQPHAVDYLKQNSYHLTTRSDMYLYSRVTKTPKPKNNGGGSSVHRSAGGRSHGGRGGRF